MSGKMIQPNPIIQKLTLIERGITPGVPFFDPLVGAWLCIGEPAQDCVGFSITAEQLEVLSDTLRTAAFFETADIKFISDKNARHLEFVEEFKNRISSFYGMRENILRIPNIQDVHYFVLLGWYQNDMEEMFNKFFQKYQSVPYLTYFWKTQDAKQNIELLECELAMLNPKKAFAVFDKANPGLGPDAEVTGMLDHFNTEYWR